MQPELQLPPTVVGNACIWELKHNGHPLWVIPRRKTEKDVANCEIADQATTVILCCQPKQPLGSAATATTVTYIVRLPYIVDMKPIASDDKVIFELSLMDI